MGTHSTAPGRSSAELKTRVGNFMRRADAILAHPLAQSNPMLSMTMSVDVTSGEVVSASLDHKNVPVSDLVYVATLMRPIIYLQDDPISLCKLTGRIEHEHPGFRGKL